MIRRVANLSTKGYRDCQFLAKNECEVNKKNRPYLLEF